MTVFTLVSCVPRKKIAYFQNIEVINGSDSSTFQPKLQSDDLLIIIVSSPDTKSAIPFNLPTIGVLNANRPDSAIGQNSFQTYLIDNQGNIQFPVLGTIKIGGLTRAEAIAMLKQKLSQYLSDPIINIRIINYKVSVLGEVRSPGSFNIQTERITLPEAISLAGDMTMYGRRDNVLVIREVNGQKTHTFIDMTKADFINSPYYYLSQNDMVVVEPNKTRMNSSAVGPNITVGISAISLIITIIAFATR